MQIRDKMKTVWQPSLGVGALLALSAFMAAGSAWKMNEAGRDMRSELAAERLVSDWASNTVSNVKRTTVLVESADPRLIGRFADDVATSSKRNTELMKKVEGVLDTEEEKILFARIAENRKAYQASRDTAFRLLAEGHGKEAYKALEEQYKPVAKRYQEMVSEFLQLERKQLNEGAHAAAQEETSDWITLTGAILLVFLAGGCAAWWLNARAGAQRREAASLPGSSDDVAAKAPNIVLLHNTARPQTAGLAGASPDPARAWDQFYDILA